VLGVVLRLNRGKCGVPRLGCHSDDRRTLEDIAENMIRIFAGAQLLLLLLRVNTADELLTWTKSSPCLTDLAPCKRDSYCWTNNQNRRGATLRMLLALKDRQIVKVLTLLLAILYRHYTRKN
jgi:hypothetical protein